MKRKDKQGALWEIMVKYKQGAFLGNRGKIQARGILGNEEKNRQGHFWGNNGKYKQGAFLGNKGKYR